jgi:hypothetical protein
VDVNVNDLGCVLLCHRNSWREHKCDQQGGYAPHAISPSICRQPAALPGRAIQKHVSFHYLPMTCQDVFPGIGNASVSGA